MLFVKNEQGGLRLPKRSYKGKIFASFGVSAVILAGVSSPLFTPRPGIQGAAPHAIAPQQQKALAGIPVIVSVPRLAVYAPVDIMGLTPQGDMEAPTDAARTGWYKKGPRPGTVGSAVIAGHFGRWKTGESSVFDKLHTLKPGDKVEVRDEAGATTSFVVRETRIFGRNEDAKAIFTSHDGKSHLNLITCHGTWDESKKTYSDRLVVFTDKE